MVQGDFVFGHFACPRLVVENRLGWTGRRELH